MPTNMKRPRLCPVPYLDSDEAGCACCAELRYLHRKKDGPRLVSTDYRLAMRSISDARMINWPERDRKKNLMRGRSRRSFRGHSLSDLPDLLPQFLAPGASLGRVRKQPCRGIFLSQHSQSTVQLIVRHAVGLGCDQQELAARGAQKSQELLVAFLRRNVGVDQRNTQSKRRALIQIRFNKFRPLLRNLARNLRVAVTWEVGENQLWIRFPRPANLKEINAARSSGCGTGARQLGADQRINHARLTNIGPPEEGNLWQRRGREVCGISRRRQKSRQNSHAQVCNDRRAIGKPKENESLFTIHSATNGGLADSNDHKSQTEDQPTKGPDSRRPDARIGFPQFTCDIDNSPGCDNEKNDSRTNAKRPRVA